MKNKKYLQFIFLILSFSMMLTLFACNEEDPNGVPTANVSDGIPTEAPEELPTDDSSEISTSAPTEVTADITTEAPSEVTSEAPTSAPAEADSTTQPTEAPTEILTEQPTEEETTEEETTEEETTEEETTEEETTEEETECRHSYAYACTAECSICGYIRQDPAQHNYPADAKCGQIECTDCKQGYYVEHSMVLSGKSTATLLSSGTVVYECEFCDKSNSEESLTALDPALLGMPIVYITELEGERIPLKDLQKPDGEIVVKYQYVSDTEDVPSFECYSKIKVQGGTSAERYPKKNFNIKLYTDETLTEKNKIDLGWGKENKYCMKANYIDFSQARNIVGARMFAQMVESRDNIAEGLKNAPNYGLIDGYPILVYLNGEFYGLYTMNIPKDDWQFAMNGDKNAKEAILMGDGWSNYVSLKEMLPEFTGIDAWETYGFELEYASDEANADWVRTSFNSLIALLNSGNRAAIKKMLPDRLDIEAAIDNMIFTYFLNAKDNRSKNIIWATYDGKKWIPSMYDMDGTFGNYWNGQPIGTVRPDYPEDATHTFPYYDSNGNIRETGNQMWKVLLECFPEQVKARYTELRKTVLTTENTEAVFGTFFSEINEIAYTSDAEKWGGTDQYKWAAVTRFNMYKETEAQLKRLDDFFYNLPV